MFVDDVGDVTFLGRGRRVLPGVTAVGVDLIGKGFCERVSRPFVADLGLIVVLRSETIGVLLRTVGARFDCCSEFLCCIWI